MGYIKTQAEAKELLTDRYSFNAGSLTAQWEYTATSTTQKVYVVRSYGVIIATRASSGITQFNPNKYSVTTTRHTNLVRKAWGLI